MKKERVTMVQSMSHKELAENLVMVARSNEHGCYFSSEEEVVEIIKEALDIVSDLGKQKREH